MNCLKSTSISYERDISHCEPTSYVKMVTIKNIEPALNSDFLDIVAFEEMGWNAVSKRGEHKLGDKVMFIPPESVLPYELGEKLEITKHLSKGRVRVVKLRGNRSEGLIVDKDIVSPYIPHIMKWEDLPTVQMRGEVMSPSDVSPYFNKFYKMPNILNEPHTFEVGEEVVVSEKIHGTNCRFGYLKHPHTGLYQLYVGSHERTLKESDDNIYWRTVKEIVTTKRNLSSFGSCDCCSEDRHIHGPVDIVFYGEIFGRGIQHLHYGQKEPNIRVFAASRDGRYLGYQMVSLLCGTWDIPHIKFVPMKFESIEQLRELAEAPSVYTAKHRREGIVIVSQEYPEKMAKCISFSYLAGKKKTERH